MRDFLALAPFGLRAAHRRPPVGGGRAPVDDIPLNSGVSGSLPLGASTSLSLVSSSSLAAGSSTASASYWFFTSVGTTGGAGGGGGG